MMKKFLHIYSIMAVLLVFNEASAQQYLPLPRNISNAVKNGTRTLTGQPGPQYWVNSADYQMEISFDPATRVVKGTQKIIYHNNSKDSLRTLVLKLYPNIYQKGAPHDRFISPADQNDGVKLTRVIANGKAVFSKPTTPRGTVTNIAIPMLRSGESVQLEIDYNYELNKGSHNRTGQVDSGAFFIAYSFPRIAVYDDIDGWDRNTYVGQDEFYNDNSNFDVKVTVPASYAVWATGDLLNAKEVFQPAVAERLAKAEISDDIITVIDSTDVAAGNVVQPNASNTFHFNAKNVPDFAFAVSNHYMWHSSSVEVDPTTKRRTRVDAVFNKAHKDYFEVIDFARATVYNMSYKFPAWPYPYAHETVFDGLDQMEYPMMVNDNPTSSKQEGIELTVHEIFHTMFPFYMGINETKYAWMDEGWASVGEWIISPLIDTTIIDDYGIAPYSGAAGNEIDLPIINLTVKQNASSYFLNAYAKPAMGYYYVRDLLGAEKFNKALHHYIKSWNGKHPTPTDFFYSMNEGSGMNLNWFWKKWFYEDGFPDLAISNVKKNNNQYTVTVASKGTKPVPVTLHINFADGTSQKMHKTIACWEKGEKSTVFTFTTTKEVNEMVVGNVHVSDVNPADNTYKMVKLKGSR
ncbi:hypothetical protein LX64_01176 [Chitinophaga skermanii]|uniref:Peptidase M1 membrane alanine aminopeptidase domain-containing protein n=1 Tax=Chitinophaga skermanii TaxID=331697 RepID=A0A327QYM5_9BACT|nr:M1 family metallopeptidase [Chitinophaga skermanii]RAJ08523.1 hypothetical protein LX64_01176 [Chitinophaga skermanii]